MPENSTPDAAPEATTPAPGVTEGTTEASPAPAKAADIDWKAEARKWEERAKSNATKLKEAEPIVSQWKQLEEASKSELQRAQEQLTNWQTRAETLQNSLVTSRIEALATVSEFADPSDAIAALDPSKYLGLEGAVDEDAIRKDLAAVLDKKPHWRKAPAAPPGPRTPAPNPAQGSGGGAPAPADPAQAFAAHINGLLTKR